MTTGPAHVSARFSGARRIESAAQIGREARAGGPCPTAPSDLQRAARSTATAG